SRARKWVARRAPWLSRQELDRLLDEAIRHPRRWKADPLGAELGLSATVRDFLDIRTIGACDITKRQRQHLRRKRKRLKEAERRRENGAKPRGASITQLQPWKKAGISRRTWYRRRATDLKEAAE